MPKKKNKSIVKANFTVKKLIIFAVIVLASLITLFFYKTFERWLGINNPFYDNTANASYKIHFVDVGQGDCTIFEFSNGDILVVDSGPGKSENAVKNYFNQQAK